MVFPNCPGAIGTAERPRIYGEETGHLLQMNKRRATQPRCSATRRTAQIPYLEGQRCSTRMQRRVPRRHSNTASRVGEIKKQIETFMLLQGQQRPQLVHRMKDTRPRFFFDLPWFLLFTVIADFDPFLLASLPAGITQISEQSRVSFAVLLALFVVTDLVEVANLTIGVPSSRLVMFSTTCHALSALFLLKFSIDLHPVGHFWWLFGLLSVPPFIIALSKIAHSLLPNKASR